MSKKKASGGSTTMTLKDFHGGSIPSDLPLPSAPGVIVRPTERSGLDRSGAWGHPNGGSDHRLRPGSAGAVRNFDDKTPFLSPSAPIGRNFDEDERKPLSGLSGPRRTVSDENIRGLPLRTELKPNYPSTGRLPSSYAARVTEAPNMGVNSQHGGSNSCYSNGFSEAAFVGTNSSNLVGTVGEAVSGIHPNAWSVRNEAVSTTEPLPVGWSGLDAGSKLAHASALEKVSSGRWQSRQSIHHQADVEAIRHSIVESQIQLKDERFHDRSGHHSLNSVGGVEYHDLARLAERSLAVENSPSSLSGVQRAHDGVKIGELAVHSELSERPKLKLLRRSKPLDSPESNLNCKQDHQQSYNSDQIPGSYGNRAVERPKLNLKPQSGPIEQLEGYTQRERNTVFGDARPRELVLKDRDVDDVVNNNHAVDRPTNRNKQDAPRTEIVPKHATHVRQKEKPENRRNNREIQKLAHHHQPKERPRSPETWRKPVEQPKPGPPEASGLHQGKIASALELALAFPRSVSDPKTAPQGLPGQAQMPFSRLMNPTSRPQINGH
ncbi:hypothetical protein NMG60_11022381 [Bertholletia excelsa]